MMLHVSRDINPFLKVLLYLLKQKNEEFSSISNTMRPCNATDD